MKRLILLVTSLMMLSVPALASSTGSAEVSLHIAPVVITSLNVSPTWYDFGMVSVGESTCTVFALVLENNGNVGATLEKAVWDDDDWDISGSSTSVDGFNLWAMTGSTQKGQNDFTPANGHEFSKSVLGTFNNLTDESGIQEDLNPTDTANLWFRLDMPQAVSTSAQQVFHIKFRATAK